MTRSNPDPNKIREGLNLIGEVLAGRRHATRRPGQGTPTAGDAWRTAITKAGRKHCAEHGHRYQVHGRHDPTKITCPTCGRTSS